MTRQLSQACWLILVIEVQFSLFVSWMTKAKYNHCNHSIRWKVRTQLFTWSWHHFMHCEVLQLNVQRANRSWAEAVQKLQRLVKCISECVRQWGILLLKLCFGECFFNCLQHIVLLKMKEFTQGQLANRMDTNNWIYFNSTNPCLSLRDRRCDLRGKTLSSILYKFKAH